MHTSPAISKIVMLLAMNVLTVKSFIPPNKAVSTDKIAKGTFLDRYVASLAKFISLPAVIVPNITLCFVVLTRYLSTKTPWTARICSQAADDELGRLSPSFLGLFLLVVVGASIRLHCFKCLGDLFTFEVTIRSNHKIIDFGPYAIVRHPSYTGLLMVWVGTALLVFSFQSPGVACGWAASSYTVKAMMVLWFSWMAFTWHAVVKRVATEEGRLRKYFGEEWDEYTKRVPYQFIPWIC